MSDALALLTLLSQLDARGLLRWAPYGALALGLLWLAIALVREIFFYWRNR